MHHSPSVQQEGQLAMPESETTATRTPDLATIAITAGRSANGASVAPVLFESTTFESEGVDQGRRDAMSTRATEFYSRHGNPTVGAFESAIAALEGAEAARAFASGMGAVSAVILGLCSTGDHVVAQRQMYSGTTMLLTAACPRFGIDVTFVDGTDPEAWNAAIRPGKTTVLWAETPANPRLDLIDLEAFGALKGPIKVVDSTIATPLGQQPLRYGVDLVVHSATKFLAGHNDTTLGVIAGSRELIDWLWGFAVLQGASASPRDALAGIKGLRTLAVRTERQSATAQVLAERLQADPRIESVFYPGLPSHPQAHLVGPQLRQTGGLVTFDVAGGLDAGRLLVESTKICRLATSFGGTESMLTHPASTTHVGLRPDEMAAAGVAPGTIRMSVGLEHVDDIWADLDAALPNLSNG